MTKRRTLAEAAEDAISRDGKIECPRCGCRDFRVYGNPPKCPNLRYKRCRHCDYRILTYTESKERIVRAITDDDGDAEIVSFLA